MKNKQEKKDKKDMRKKPVITDPQGSYTGRPVELYETPVQDADDL